MQIWDVLEKVKNVIEQNVIRSDGNKPNVLLEGQQETITEENIILISYSSLDEKVEEEIREIREGKEVIKRTFIAQIEIFIQDTFEKEAIFVARQIREIFEGFWEEWDEEKGEFLIISFDSETHREGEIRQTLKATFSHKEEVQISQIGEIQIGVELLFSDEPEPQEQYFEKIDNERWFRGFLDLQLFSKMSKPFLKEPELQEQYFEPLSQKLFGKVVIEQYFEKLDRTFEVYSVKLEEQYFEKLEGGVV